MVDDNRADSDETRIDTDDAATNVTTDRETMRTWVEDSGAKPAYRTTEEGEREPYIHHPDDDSTTDVEETSWDEFHQRLDEDDLALARRGDRPAEGSDQFEFVDRTEAVERAALDDEEVEQALMEGETVETEITETRVVEKTVQETETVESEVVDSDIVRDEIVDTELVRREIADVHLGDDDTGVAIIEDSEATAWEEDHHEIDPTDHETVTVDVDETREATRELIERKTVESRVTDHDIETDETVETDTLEGRVDLEGVQRSVLESDVLDGSVDADEAIETGYVESEFTDDAAIETHLYERRIVEDEVVDRKRLTFELTDEDVVDSETVTSALVETALIGSDASGEAVEGERIDAEGVAIDRDETATAGVTTGAETDTTAAETETTGAEATATPEETTAGERDTAMGDEATTDETIVEDEAVTLDDDDVGKDVVDDTGEKVGVVTEVDEDDNRLYVDPNPGLAQRVKTRLGWEGHDDDAYAVEPDRIAEIDDDYVRLRSP